MASNIRALKTDALSWAHDVRAKTKHSAGNPPPYQIDDTNTSFTCLRPIKMGGERTQTQRHLVHQDFVSNFTNLPEVVACDREVEVVDSVCIQWNSALCFDKKLQVALPSQVPKTSISSITLGNGAADKYLTKSKVLVSAQGISMGAKQRKAVQILAEQEVYTATIEVGIGAGCPASQANVVARADGHPEIPGNLREILRYLADCRVPGYTKQTSGEPIFQCKGTIEVRKNVRLYCKVGDGQSI